MRPEITMSSPLASGQFRRASTWKGPSTVLSNAPDGFRLLMASTGIDTPNTSDSRMDPCRDSLHI